MVACGEAGERGRAGAPRVGSRIQLAGELRAGLVGREPDLSRRWSRPTRREPRDRHGRRLRVGQRQRDLWLGLRFRLALGLRCGHLGAGWSRRRLFVVVSGAVDAAVVMSAQSSWEAPVSSPDTLRRAVVVGPVPGATISSAIDATTAALPSVPQAAAGAPRLVGGDAEGCTAAAECDDRCNRGDRSFVRPTSRLPAGRSQ